MSIIPGQGNTSYTSVSALDKILAELKKLRTAITTGTTGDATAGNQVLEIAALNSILADTGLLATEATLASVDALLTTIDSTLTTIYADMATAALQTSTQGILLDVRTAVEALRDIIIPITNTYLSYEVWDKIPGNSKELTWVAGTVTPFVVDTIVYKTGVNTIVTQTFTYDANDNVLSITAS